MSNITSYTIETVYVYVVVTPFENSNPILNSAFETEAKALEYASPGQYVQKVHLKTIQVPCEVEAQ
jgi:hypothetical protein